MMMKTQLCIIMFFIAIMIGCQGSNDHLKALEKQTLVFEIDKEGAVDLGMEVTSKLSRNVAKQVEARIEDLAAKQGGVLLNQVRAGEKMGQIVVVLQGNAEAVKQLIANSTRVEFAILANSVQHKDIIALAKDPANSKNNRVFNEGQLVGLWCPVALDQAGEPKIELHGKVETRPSPEGNKSPLEYLVIVDPNTNRRITSRYFVDVQEVNSDFGLAFSFTFNERGGYLLGQLTSKNQPRPNLGMHSRLAILLNGSIHSAPTINGIITTRGIITGKFTQQDIDSLLSSLSLKGVSVPLRLVEEKEPEEH